MASNKRNTFNEDELLEQEFNAAQMKKLLRYVARHKKDLFVAIVIILLSSAVGLIGPLLMMHVIDDFIPKKNINMLIVSALAFTGLTIFSAVCMNLRIKFMSQIGQSVVRDIRSDIFSHIQKLPFTFYDSRPHGKILVRVVNYVNSLSDLLSNGLINLIVDFFSFFVAFAIMLALEVRLTLMAFAFVPVAGYLIFLVKGKQRRSMQELSAKQSNMNAYIHESISGMKVTQSFTREEVNEKVFIDLMDENKDVWMKSRHYLALIFPIVKNISVLSQCLMLFMGIAFFKGEISAGTMVALLGYVGNFWNPLLNISEFYNQLVAASAYLERIFETMDIEPEIQDAITAYPLPSIHGKVSFKEVDFGYEDGQEILKNFNLEVEPGQKIALVGPTGAGKTTVVNLIARFYDVRSGAVTIDGHNVKEVQLKSLREQLGIMMQDSFIFSGTILDNIRYGKLDATEEEIIQAAKAVKAHDFIVEMKEGYYTEVNERGTRLSTGQRQLISFARALLKNPKILILDEATSSIDTQTEKIIQEGLEELLKGRTSFIIAHRLSTIKMADQILVINNKGIEEVGSHDELIEKKGHYYNLYSAQLKFIL